MTLANYPPVEVRWRKIRPFKLQDSPLSWDKLLISRRESFISVVQAWHIKNALSSKFPVKFLISQVTRWFLALYYFVGVIPVRWNLGAGVRGCEGCLQLFNRRWLYGYRRHLFRPRASKIIQLDRSDMRTVAQPKSATKLATMEPVSPT